MMLANMLGVLRPTFARVAGLVALALLSGCRDESECCPISNQVCATWTNGQRSSLGDRNCIVIVNDGARAPRTGYITRYAEDGCPYLVPPPPDTPGITFCGGDPDAWVDTRGLIDAPDEIDESDASDVPESGEDSTHDGGDSSAPGSDSDTADSSDAEDDGDVADGSGPDAAGDVEGGAE